MTAKVMTRREALAKSAEMLGKAESGAISEQRAILYLELGRQYMAMAHELKTEKTPTPAFIGK